MSLVSVADRPLAVRRPEVSPTATRRCNLLLQCGEQVSGDPGIGGAWDLVFGEDGDHAKAVRKKAGHYEPRRSMGALPRKPEPLGEASSWPSLPPEGWVAVVHFPLHRQGVGRQELVMQGGV